MSLQVRVECVDCGPLAVTIKDLRLFTTPNVYESRYAFTCPKCLAWINRPAPPAMVQGLRWHGVPEVRQHVPREVFELHRGPALGVDEVLDFALEVRDVDELARFACRR